MLHELKRLGKESVVYGLSTVAGRLLNFFLLPFYTHFLTTGEYGIVATLFAYLAFLNIIYQYGMDQAYLKFSTSLEIGDREDSFSTSMWCLTATSLVFSALLAFFSKPIAASIGLAPDLWDMPAYGAGILAFDALSIIAFAELRREHRAWMFVGIKLANIIVNVALNILFLWRMELGVRGVFLASWIAAAVSLISLLPIMARRWRGKFHSALFPELLRFAAPYIPAGLASMAVQVIDRPILKALTDDATVGIYQANYRLGIFMMLVVNMFDAAWRPFFLERAGKSGAQEVFARVLTYFLLAGSFICLALSLFIGDIVRFPIWGRPLIHPAYWGGLGVVPVVLVGYLFNGAYINFMAQVTLTKRTDKLIWTTALGATVNVAANFALIPSMGMMGAAWATLLAYAAMASCLFTLGQKVYPIHYEYKRLVHLMVLAAACGFAARSLHLMFGPADHSMTWAAARIGIIFSYPMILWMTGFFEPAEREAALRFIGGRVR